MPDILRTWGCAWDRSFGLCSRTGHWLAFECIIFCAGRVCCLWWGILIGFGLAADLLRFSGILISSFIVFVRFHGFFARIFTICFLARFFTSISSILAIKFVFFLCFSHELVPFIHSSPSPHRPFLRSFPFWRWELPVMTTAVQWTPFALLFVLGLRWVSWVDWYDWGFALGFWLIRFLFVICVADTLCRNRTTIVHGFIIVVDRLTVIH